MPRLGLIAGAGTLPVVLARHCQDIGRPLFILRLRGFSDPALTTFDGVDVGLAELGKGMAALRGAHCDAVCFAGVVARPEFKNLTPDWRGLAVLPGAIKAARRGDDGLLAFLVGEFEREGFRVEGAHEVMGDLTPKAGLMGAVGITQTQQADVDRALFVARAIGGMDIGQGAVSCDGLILAVEAQEGTDTMLRRVAALPDAVRGNPTSRRGVLAKVCKPGQEERIDLPTIGPATVVAAGEAGLAGIAGEAGRLLVLDRQATIDLADSLGIFLVCVA